MSGLDRIRTDSGLGSLELFHNKHGFYVVPVRSKPDCPHDLHVEGVHVRVHSRPSDK